MDMSKRPHPLRASLGAARQALLASPIKGEVPLHSWGTILPTPRTSTSPLMGEAGRGWGNTRTSLRFREVLK
jgi:hypothetical protein